MPGKCIIYIFSQRRTIPGNCWFRSQCSSGIQIGRLGKSYFCLREIDLTDKEIISQSSGIKAKTCDREASQTAITIIGERNRIIFSLSQRTTMEF